ncbi:MAG: porin family protein [Bdellovibrionaceae bacterium]|nr:porin family protein [Pseudobdellovibrionaceae bacterium]
MKKIIYGLALILGASAGASTFVGNGGNAGDVELQVTINQLQKAFVETAKPSADAATKLCVCHEDFQGKPLCEMLKKLDEEQVRFCDAYIKEKSPELAELLARKDRVHFSWTNDSIEVQENGKLRDADAVTSLENKSMTLNQARFLSMSDMDRVFLMGHEVFHLTSSNGKTLSDTGPVGPFKGADGGRQFINAMAAAIVMQIHKYDLFDEYRGAIRRSKSYKTKWVSLDILSITTDKSEPNAYYINQHSGGRLGLRYQLTNEWGVVGEFANLKGNKDILTSIKGEENKDVFSFGVAYRLVPFHNPLNFAGQSHFVFRGKVDLIQAKYKLYDPYVEMNDTASTTGYSADVNYFIPFLKGFWAQAGLGYSIQKYKFEKINVEYKTNGLSLNTGVSYGF